MYAIEYELNEDDLVEFGVMSLRASRHFSKILKATVVLGCSSKREVTIAVNWVRSGDWYRLARPEAHDTRWLLVQPRTPRTLGLKLIIAYKLVKAPVMLALAIWLTFAPRQAYQVAAEIARELAAASAFWVRLGHWIEELLSMRIFRWAAVVAWLDFVSTALEAALLLMGKAWGEWLVTIGLAALLVPELFSLEHRPSWTRLLVLLINAVVVVYLAARRVRALRAA